MYAAKVVEKFVEEHPDHPAFAGPLKEQVLARLREREHEGAIAGGDAPYILGPTTAQEFNKLATEDLEYIRIGFEALTGQRFE